MSNIIQLLERMGQDADLQNPLSLADAISTSNLTPELKQALSSNDITSLEKQLDICPDIVCMMLPAEGEKPAEDEKPADESQPEDKDNDPSNT
ncbi:hypothetical protein BCU94_18325 [Shewanella sp. 10N.286.52.C2]|uniref:hypothetical protein n=1 Tax=unclassified Shewanella TaxID=196818 RepID=UPI000C82B1CD|nr:MULTISPECIES: hypothetical protein [unclassified Shewanella]MDO6639077.1 hypothetical protein [Shewanella sp. 5_MG-2023]PMG28064.1 hypothetical protein BCU94_18325 [Shewanella sp. 10N.286.52.C2]PMI01683.1 hypothetical protein BCU55_09745 [Shewanella sp. 10N.286.48.A6]